MNTVNNMIVVFAVTPVTLYKACSFDKEIVLRVIHLNNTVACTVYSLAVIVLAYALQSVILADFKSTVIEVENTVLMIVISADKHLA